MIRQSSEEWTHEQTKEYGRTGKVPPRPSKPFALPSVAKPEKSRLAVQWEQIWENIGGQSYIEEWQGIPGRQFRFDYTFLDPTTGRVLALVEIEGSTRQGGRHQKMQGFENDSVKYFLASVVYGWPVIRITRSILKQPENLVLVRHFIERQRSAIS